MSTRPRWAAIADRGAGRWPTVWRLEIVRSDCHDRKSRHRRMRSVLGRCLSGLERLLSVPNHQPDVLRRDRAGVNGHGATGGP
eukprot:2902181-Prymnesium_polylepis.1